MAPKASKDGTEPEPLGIPDPIGRGDPLGLGAPRPEELAKTRTDLQGSLAGDDEAFARLWSRLHPALEVLTRGRIRAATEPALRSRLDSESEDLLQDVAVTIHRKLARFEYRGPGSLLAWASQIATNLARDWADHWRAGRRHPRLEQPLAARRAMDANQTGSFATALQSSSAGPVTSADLAERRRRVASALATLEEREHTIVFWRYFGGAEWDEIAREVGAVSADAVRMECYTKVLPALAALLKRTGMQE